MNTESSPPFHHELRARDGALCIYAEKWWMAHVKLTILAFTDKAVEFRLHALPTPGFTPPEPTWEAGVAFTEGTFGPDYWMGSIWARWIVCFDPEATSSLIAIAHAVQNRPADERSFALWNRLSALIHPELNQSAS